jgi:hypothetical protein
VAQQHDIGYQKRAHAEELPARKKRLRRVGSYRDWCRTSGHPASCSIEKCLG